MATTDDIVAVSDHALLIYSWVVFGGVCQIINIFGIVTNFINIICFVKQGFEDSVNISLIGLSVSDLFSLMTMFVTCFYLTPAVMTSDWGFNVVDIMFFTSGIPHLAFTRVSSCITAMITIERCLCITAPLQIKSIITPRRSAVITVSVFIIFFFSDTPFYVVNKLEIQHFPKKNKTLLGLVSSSDHQENVQMILYVVNHFFIPFVAFLIIVVCTSILALKLRSSARWRKTFMNSAHNNKVTVRNQRTSKMVIMISALFLVCFIPSSVIMLAASFVQEFSPHGKYLNLGIMVGGFGYVMESINFSMNIFIYNHMSSKFRESLHFLMTRKIYQQ